MLVSDFFSVISGGMFTVVDATKTGYLTSPRFLHSGGDKNVIRSLGFDKYILKRAEAIGKNKYCLYVVPTEE